jgi:branched-chain amino acid transport system substrate-binding protein
MGKHQMTSTKSQINSNQQNLKFKTRLGHLIFDIWNLFGFWNLGFGISVNFILIAFVLLLTLPFTCLSQPSVKVGALIPFTGRWGDSAKECAKGILDATKWLNQRVGIAGMKLEVILIDDTSDLAETIAAFRKLNEADQILLLYVHSTETALALLPHIQFNRVPTLASSLPFHLSNPVKYPYLFSINPTDLDLSKIAVKFVLERSGIQMRSPKIVFVGSPDHSSRYFLEETKKYARQMGLAVGPDIWLSGLSPSFPLSIMNSYNPDFAYLSLGSKEALSMLQEAKGIDLRTRWICSAKAFDETLVPLNGVYGVQPVAPFGEDVPGMAEIKEAHQRWHPFDSHTLSYVEGWATIQVTAEALGRAVTDQGLSRERVKPALESFKNFILGGLVPPLTITPMDHRPSVESRIFITKDGKISKHTEFISVGR